MKISILCSNETHPVMPWLVDWQTAQHGTHDVEIKHQARDLTGGDVLFLVSCTEIVGHDLRRTYGQCVVLHASDLPEGRGWSPHIWAILSGAESIVVSALTAESSVDTGDIWAKRRFGVEPGALHDEINTGLFATEIALMEDVLAMIEAGQQPSPQAQENATYHPRRTPEDSKLDPHLSLAEQFDLMRVCDPARFPAFFDLHGHTYKITLEKVHNNEQS